MSFDSLEVYSSPLSKTIEKMLTWVLEKLPALNDRVYRGEMTALGMAAIANEEILNQVPLIKDLTDDKSTKQLLAILGMLGSSVERHAQQEFVKRELAAVVKGEKERPDSVKPGHGLKLLRVSESQTFVDYFQELAQTLGHPYRDSFATFIEFNGPTVRVQHPRTGKLLWSVPAVFPNGAFCTFTAQQSEIDFISLLKKSFALQEAANLFLEKLQQDSTDLTASSAIEATFNTATLMRAVHSEIVEFMRFSRFNVDFFLDYLRQYACLWYAEYYLKPPSGANDYASLQRDLILFEELLPPGDGFPGYHQHVRQVFSVLMPHEIAKLEAAMSQPSLENKIFRTLGMTREQFEQLQDNDVLALLANTPWLAAYCELYLAQRELSRVHYSSIKKYLVRPKKLRDAKRDPRETVTVVSNRYGTTGMDPLGLVKRLDWARANHPLARISSQKTVKAEVNRLARDFGYLPLQHDQLLGLSSFAP